MKYSKIWLVITIFFTFVAFLIAIPTIRFEWKGEEYVLRGLELRDFGITSANTFAFRSSVELQGGYQYAYNVDLSGVEEAEKQKEFDQVVEIIKYRLSRLSLNDVSLSALSNTKNDNYQIIIRSPEEINNNLLIQLVQEGRIGLWVQDFENEDLDAAISEDPVYGGRIETSISNDEILHARVVADSRIYVNDAEDFRNYGIEMFLNEEAQEELLLTFLNIYSIRLPILISVDGAPVAVQASGQVIDPANPPNSLLLYPIVQDEYLETSMLAGIMSSETVDHPVEFTESKVISPLLGEYSLNSLKISLVVGFLLFVIFVLLFYSERGTIFTVIPAIMVIWSIAFMKIANLTLSIYLILGFLAALFILITYLINIQTSFLSNVREKVGRKNLQLFVESHFLSFWKMLVYLVGLVAIILLIEVVPQRGIVSLSDFSINLLLVFYNIPLLQFTSGMILGATTVLLIRFTAFKGLLAILLNEDD